MKRDKMGIILVWTISLLVFSGCSVSTSSSNDVQIEEPFVSNVEVTEAHSITVDSINDFIKGNQHCYRELDAVKDNEIRIEEREFQGQILYFLLYTPTDYWSTSLYQIREQNGELLDLHYITEGATEYLNFDIITISEGKYIVTYSASYIGNGNLVLVDLEKTERRKVGAVPDYEFYAVDTHYEQMQIDNAPIVSSIFENEVLIPEYTDVNQDGHTDILLTGVIEEYEYDIETDMQNMKNKKEVYQVYQYEPETKKFILESGEDLREKRQVSLSDSVINNHELLNDTLCFEYKVQDILQYHGEPLKTIHSKDGEGKYHHYLVYDGIIYVVIGEENIDDTQYIDYVILTNDIYSFSIGIQVGMDVKELADTGLYFEPLKNGDDLDSQLLSGKAGYLRKMKIKYDTIYYAEGSFDENIALAVIVKDGKVLCIATDKLY